MKKFLLVLTLLVPFLSFAMEETQISQSIIHDKFKVVTSDGHEFLLSEEEIKQLNFEFLNGLLRAKKAGMKRDNPIEHISSDVFQGLLDFVRDHELKSDWSSELVLKMLIAADFLMCSPSLIKELLEKAIDILPQVSWELFLKFYSQLVFLIDAYDMKVSLGKKLVPVHKDIEEGFYSAQLSPDGECLAFMTSEGKLKILNLRKDIMIELPDECHLNNGSDQVNWSPNGSQLILTEHQHLTQRYEKTKRGWRELTFGTPINLFKWSLNGNFIAVSMGHGVPYIEIYNQSFHSIQKLRLNNRIHSSDGIDWSPTDLQIAIVDGKSVRIFQLGTELPVHELVHEETCSLVSWSFDGNFLATATAKKIKIWDTHTWQCIRTFANCDHIYLLRWSPQGGKLAFGDWKQIDDGYKSDIQVWDVQTENCSHAFYAGYVLLNWSPDGLRLAIAPMRGKELSVWDIETGALVFEYSFPQFIKSINLFNDGLWVLTQSKSWYFTFDTWHQLALYMLRSKNQEPSPEECKKLSLLYKALPQQIQTFFNWPCYREQRVSASEPAAKRQRK